MKKLLKMRQYLVNLYQKSECFKEKGITININGSVEKIYFKLSLIIGDNLGMHTLLELTESFSSNFRCRFCKIKKINSYHMCTEDKTLFRTHKNYGHDLITNDATKTNIKEQCIWHQLSNFHLTRNYCVDIMHDLFEGMCNNSSTS